MRLKASSSPWAERMKSERLQAPQQGRGPSGVQQHPAAPVCAGVAGSTLQKELLH